MGEGSKEPQGAADPQQLVGRAIQELTAARLGRAFVPLVVTLIVGIVQVVRFGSGSPGGAMLIVGATATGAAMLAYGLRVTQQAFGRTGRRWMTLAMFGSVIPPSFALYLLGWRGLRLFVVGGGLPVLASALLFTLLGLWIMRSWMKVVEVERLARVMQIGT